MLVLWQLYDDVYNRKSTRVEIRRHSFEFLLQYLPGAWILVNYLYPLIHSCLLWKWNGLPMSENSCDVILGDICQSTYNSWHIFLKENLFVIIPLFFFFWLFSTESEWEGWRSWRNQARWWLQRDGEGESSSLRFPWHKISQHTKRRSEKGKGKLFSTGTWECKSYS